MAKERTNSAQPEPVTRLVDELSRLPGVGRRTAERLAFHLLKSTREEAMRLSKAIADVKTDVHHCSVCWNLTDGDPCSICADARRDASMVMVVEQPKDLWNLEQTGMFRGVYHILMGRLSPLEGVGADSLTANDLLRRVREASKNARGVKVTEVILALNPDMEGDSTGLYLAEPLQSLGVQVTRLARGLPAGSQIEFANRAALADAVAGRRPMS
ncbi:MAG: recombination mediator RecR [Planctomycetes bacterium]|nr:recombination mediator RecR [Planctomycetota bacterium]